MEKSPQENEPSSEFPRPQDGFHKPSPETRRRNLITAGIILFLLGSWILFGLRHVLFGG